MFLYIKAFLRRHPEIVERTSEAVTAASSRVSEENIRKWFDEVQDYIRENDPSRIFNEDETGFQMCPSTGRVLAEKGAKKVYSIDEGSPKENITVTGVDSSCSSCHKTITSESRGLRCDDCNNSFHEKCIPKYHKEHIPISEDGDEFLCHMCYKEKPPKSSTPSNEKWEEEEGDYDEYDSDDDDIHEFSLANKQK